MNESVRKALEKAKKAQQKYLYNDTFTLYRSVEPEEDWETDREWVAILTDEPCHFSQADAAVPNQTETVHDITTDYAIFFDNKVQAIAGDRFVIFHDGRIWEMYYGGKPAVYRSHQKQRLSKEDEYA